jgi:hypothetical protein
VELRQAEGIVKIGTEVMHDPKRGQWVYLGFVGRAILPAAGFQPALAA